MNKLEQTQYFDAKTVKPKHPGRYKYKTKDATRPVMRWWNGTNWQLNRRKAIPIDAHAGDQWAGAATLHPEVEHLLSMGLSSSDKQLVKLPIPKSTLFRMRLNAKYAAKA